MNSHGKNDWNTQQPRWLLPIFVFTMIVAAGLGVALAFATH
jgi:hypothetical protein